MERSGKDIFEANKDRVINLVCDRLNINRDQLKFVGGFENMIYELDGGDNSHIFRITDSIHRSYDAVSGELAFIDYLARNGLSVAQPLKSSSGKLVEKIEFTNDKIENFYFSLVIFEKAPGGHPQRGEWNESLYEEWGRLLGRLHNLSRQYNPAELRLKRREWDEDVDLNYSRFIPQDQKLVRQRFEEIFDRLASLPRHNQSYGLTHNDAHAGNLFVHDNKIILFDFDDCQYDWYINDLAIVLFYALRDIRVTDGTPQDAGHFWKCFMNGYRDVAEFDPGWLELIPLFLKVREMCLYTVIYAEQCFDISDWVRSFMDGRREAIENNIPVLDIDFAV